MKTRPERITQRTTRSGTRGVRPPTTSAHKGKTKVAKSTLNPKTQLKAKSRRSENYVPDALQEYHTRTTKDPNHSSILLRQPREIFDQFIEHLPIESLICLSLTCKLALQFIGSTCWTSANIKGRRYYSRTQLLKCLMRDSPPNLSFCEHCNTLHPPLQPPRLHKETRLTKTCMSQWALVDYFPQLKDGEESGYSLLFPHIQEVFKNREANTSSIDLLSANYTTSAHAKFTYMLESSATWIKGYLILQHTHTFVPKNKGSLQAVDIMELPLQLCPHHSSTTRAPTKSRHTPNRPGNAPVLIHAIVAAVPAVQRSSIPKLDTLRTPTLLEQNQMTAANQGEDVLWKCRGCTTKYRVRFEGRNLVINTWHSFGKDLAHAATYWVWMVRREGGNLGKGKRNSEFWYQSRTVPDFPIE